MIRIEKLEKAYGKVAAVWFKNSSVSQKLKIHHDFGKNHDEFCLEP
jgi:hypothetical protein